MSSGEEVHCMEMGKATGDCVPRPFSEDIWTQVAVHGPGEQAGPVKLANRSIIYRLHPPEGESFLVLLNGLWIDGEADQPFKGLRALEAETGCALRYIVSPGSGHHVSLAAYAKAFPEARICIADGRIPRVNPELAAMDNVDVYPPESPPAELAAAGLRLHVVRGLMEGPKTKRAQMLSGGGFGYQLGSVEPLFVLHEPSGSVTSGGHHMWFVPEGEESVITMPGVMKFMTWALGLDLSFMESGKFACERNNSFALSDRAAYQSSCAEVLSWEFDALIDLHAQINKCPRTGAKALLTEALGPASRGEWDKVVWKDGVLPA